MKELASRQTKGPIEKITFVPTFPGWQRAARRALADQRPPESIIWEELGDVQPALAMFDEHPGQNNGRTEGRARVPKAFVETAARVACHRDARRWALLYRLLWRLTHGRGKHQVTCARNPHGVIVRKIEP